MDRIVLTGMKFFGHHGCLPEEKKNGQPFLLDLVLELELQAAGASDDLTKTVDYSAVYTLVKNIVEKENYALIERLGEVIAARLLAAFPPIQVLQVTVHKPQAPLGGLFTDAAVTLTRQRHD